MVERRTMKIMLHTDIYGGQGLSTICIGRGLLRHIGQFASRTVKGRKAVVVSDSNVGNLHLEPVLASLRESGFSAESVCVPAGEDSKSLQMLSVLWNTFHGYGITRTDLVVALGGGVVGDLTGFAAATWLRGVRVIQVPTSLLAFVDSSIGGKTGIDLPFGKNLAGSFYQPRWVIGDPDVLRTLPEAEFVQGMAEVVKYGCIFDKAFFEDLEKAAAEGPLSDSFVEQMIAKSAGWKVDVVNRDEREGGVRTLLNFGHTLGHAAEKVLGYGYVPHGVAVGVGMVAAAKLSEKLGHAQVGLAERIAALLKALKLPTSMDEIGNGLFTAETLFEAMLSDKKKLGADLHFVLLHGIGEGFVAPLKPEFVRDLLPEILSV